MKTKLFTLLSLVLFAGALTAQPLTKQERKEAIKYIKWTSKELMKSLKGLSTAQMNYHPGEGQWSPQDCLYHIAFSEGALRGMLDQTLAAPADPAAGTEVKVTDEQVKKMVTDRSNKVKTGEPFEPQNTGFKSAADAMTAFKAKRAALIELVKTSNADFRNHVITLPFGKIDGYQGLYFLAGHTYRHTLQIQEAKASAGYPKS